MSADVWHPAHWQMNTVLSNIPCIFNPRANVFSSIAIIQCTISAVSPHRLHNAEWNRNRLQRGDKLSSFHSLIEINRFSQFSVLTVHCCSIKRIHQKQLGALHSFQPMSTLILKLPGGQCLNATAVCSSVKARPIISDPNFQTGGEHFSQTCL